MIKAPLSSRRPVRRALRDWLARRCAGSKPARFLVRGCLIAMLMACALCESLAQPALPSQPAISLEYAVKATYLYKLAPFVNWPPDEFSAPDAPFTICVLGDDPFDDYLRHAVAGRNFGGHPFEVQRLDALTREAACQIVFIRRLPSQSIKHALAQWKGRPVLTVVDSTTPVRGGVVHFVLDHGRVGFEIDTAAAARNHITISSKLLNLAMSVRARP